MLRKVPCSRRPGWPANLVAAAGLLLLLLLAAAAPGMLADSSGQGFIRAQGTKFVDSQCKEFVFSGWNS